MPKVFEVEFIVFSLVGTLWTSVLKFWVHWKTPFSPRLLMYIRNETRTNIEPSGTPALILAQDEQWLLRTSSFSNNSVRGLNVTPETVFKMMNNDSPVSHFFSSFLNVKEYPSNFIFIIKSGKHLVDWHKNHQTKNLIVFQIWNILF